MTQDVNLNDVVAFLIELAALVLLGVWAWRSAPTSTFARAVAAIVVVGAAIVLWGLFAAPEATFQVAALAIGVKVLVLGGSVLAAYAVLPAAFAGGYGVVVLVNTVLMYVGPFSR